MVRWLERNGYDVSYFTGVDTDRRGGELAEHRAFLSVGHDEYWSGQQRANVEAARGAGREPRLLQRQRGVLEDALGGQPPHAVCYKETHGDAADPTGAWTGSWRDDALGTPRARGPRTR